MKFSINTEAVEGLRADPVFDAVVEPVMQHFLAVRASKAGISDPHVLEQYSLFVRERLGGGKTGSIVLSVSWGLSEKDREYRVMKIGPLALLKDEYEGFLPFNKNPASGFCEMEEMRAEEQYPEEITFKGKAIKYGILLYRDAILMQWVYSLKGITRHLIYHYKESARESFEPNHIAEKLGRALFPIFQVLKDRIYFSQTKLCDDAANEHGKKLSSLFYRKIGRALTKNRIAEIFETDDLSARLKRRDLWRSLTGAKRNAGTTIWGEHIFGDLNPGNILLGIHESGRDIQNATLVDYGEVTGQRRVGFRFVFWDPARLFCEVLLDLCYQILLDEKSTPDKNRAAQIMRSIFQKTNPRFAKADEFIFQVLLRIVEAFFIQWKGPGSSGGRSIPFPYQTDECVSIFLHTIQAFFLFYSKFQDEDKQKRKLALQLAQEIPALRENASYNVLSRNFEIGRDFVSRRAAEVRHAELLNKRFKHVQNIAEEILPGFRQSNSSQQDAPPVEIKDESGGRADLGFVIDSLRRENRRFLIIGDGGMGKTFSLWHLFKRYISFSGPIPIYLELQEINSLPTSDANGQTGNPLGWNWIMNSILSQYIHLDRSQDNLLLLEAAFQRAEETPRYILLLDGWNEVTANENLLRESLKEIEEFRNVIVVLTSRPEVSGAFDGYHRLELTGLEDRTIEKYLSARNPPLPYPEELKKDGILHNPMFLCLYANTEERARELQSVKSKKNFITPSTSVGAILHNFLEVSRLIYLKDHTSDKGRVIRMKLLLHHLLPALGEAMESAGVFEIAELDTKRESSLNLKTVFRKVIGDVLQGEETPFLKDFEIIQLRTEESATLMQQLLGMVTSELCLMRHDPENETYRFIHQHFRDYFSALYLMQQADDFVANVEAQWKAGMDLFDHPPPEDWLPGWSRRVIPPWIRRILATLCGLDEGNANEAKMILDRFRGFDMREGDYSVWNAVEMLKERDLCAGFDFSGLDLRRVSFNMFRIDGAEFRIAQFNPTFLFQTIGRVDAVTFSADGTSLLCANGPRVSILGLDLSLKMTMELPDSVERMIVSSEGLVHALLRDNRLVTCDRDLCVLSEIKVATEVIDFDVNGKQILIAEKDRVTLHSISGVSTSVLDDANQYGVFESENGPSLSRRITSAAFIHAGSKIAISNWDGIVRIFETRTLIELLWIFVGSPITDILDIASGQQMAFSTYKFEIRIWDWNPGEFKTTLARHYPHLTDHLAESVDLLISKSRDNVVRVYRPAQSLDPVFEWAGEALIGISVAQQFCAIAHGYGCITLLALDTYEVIQEHLGSRTLPVLHYSSQRESLICASGNVVQEIDKDLTLCKQSIARHSHKVVSLLSRPDGTIISASADEILLWNNSARRIFETRIQADSDFKMKTTDHVFGLFSVGETDFFVSRHNHKFRLWDSDGNCIQELPRGAMSADGQLLAYQDPLEAEAALILSLPALSKRKVPTLPDSSIVAVSPFGFLVLSTFSEGQFLLDPGGQVVQRIGTRLDKVCFCRNSRYFAALSLEGRLRVWKNPLSEAFVDEQLPWKVVDPDIFELETRLDFLDYYGEVLLIRKETDIMILSSRERSTDILRDVPDVDIAVVFDEASSRVIFGGTDGQLSFLQLESSSHGLVRGMQTHPGLFVQGADFTGAIWEGPGIDDLKKILTQYGAKV